MKRYHLVAVSLFVISPLMAEVKLPGIFFEHMVL